MNPMKNITPPGAAKIMAPIGQAFAEAMVELQQLKNSK